MHEWGTTSLGVKNAGQRKLKSKEVDKSKGWKKGISKAALGRWNRLAEPQCWEGSLMFGELIGSSKM